jgi:two-component system chemotaxis response regulator CheY
LLDVENKISLDGHTDQVPTVMPARATAIGSLSADRANASRRELAECWHARRQTGQGGWHGVEPVAGARHPLSPSNRRISILVMTKEAEERLLGGNRIPLEVETEPSSTSCYKRCKITALIPGKNSVILGNIQNTPGKGLSMSKELRFLVVDDFSTMRRESCATCSKKVVMPTPTRRKMALQPCRSCAVRTFDFVVSDINMPNMNGFQLLAEIKKDDKLKHLPVLMVTAEARKEDIVLAAQQGAAGLHRQAFYQGDTGRQGQPHSDQNRPEVGAQRFQAPANLCAHTHSRGDCRGFNSVGKI